MMREIIYRCLDLIATILEVGLLYACNDMFDKRKRDLRWRMFPYVVTTLFVYIATWEFDFKALKILLMMVLFLVMQKIVTKAPWRNLTAAFSLYTVMISLAGYMDIVIVDGVWGYTSLQLGEHVVVSWQVYLMNCIITTICILVLRKCFSKFEYDITIGNAAVIVLYGVITYLISCFIGSGFYTGEVAWFDSTVGIFALLSGCLLLILFLYYKNNIFLKQQMMEIEQKYAFYQDKAKEEERIRGIYHDLKHHLLLLESKIQNNEEAQRMVTALQEQIADYESYQNTGNEFLDIIIRDKARIAREESIDFSAVLHFEDGDFIEALDISTIFGNALDNAIEASRMLPPQERMITVKAKRFHDMLSILVKNNISREGQKRGKEDSYIHGLGRKNIQKAVEKYAGHITIHEGEKDYTLKIMIPIP